MITCDTTYRSHAIVEHLIESKIVDQVFAIRVLQPISRADRSERFPVLYTTDSDDFFAGYATLAHHLQLHGEAPRFILVGIGYQDARLAPILRVRDFYTRAVRKLYEAETRQVAASSLVGGVDDLERVVDRTDAHDFLRFIREELLPFIEARYSVARADNNYLGYSAGGTFGVHTLFTRPDTFRRYILGSPATSCGGQHYGIPAAKAFIDSGGSMDAKVFLSVGELEEFRRGFSRFDLVTGYYRMAKFLKQAAIPGLELTTRVFPSETHATAWALAFIHGVKTLFGPAANVPFWPEFRQ